MTVMTLDNLLFSGTATEIIEKMRSSTFNPSIALREYKDRVANAVNIWNGSVVVTDQRAIDFIRSLVECEVLMVIDGEDELLS